MILTAAELELMKANSLRVSNAREFADLISADHTIGGIFPKGNLGDFTCPDIEIFRNEWNITWDINEIMLRIAKHFADEKTILVLNALLQLGNEQL